VDVSHAGNKRTITSLITPGHRAFNPMRALAPRSRRAVLVGAYDGFAPQHPHERISHARAAELPIVSRS